MRSEYSTDALVIGSGFGGAVASLRLAEAGVETTILERGRRWPITDAQDTFCTYRNPDGRAAWLSPTTVLFDPKPIEVYTGILESIQGDGITVWAGAGVGGGSLVYNGVTYKPRKEMFDRVWGGALDYDELDRVYYPRAHAMMAPSPIPQDILNTPYYLAARVFIEQAKRAGLPTRMLDIAVDWNIVRQEIEGVKKPAAIAGEIWYGINSGAKKSLDQTYLQQAEAIGRVQINPLHVVTAIFEADGGGFRVECDEIDEGGHVVRRKSYRCRSLFLGAGSVGTSRLLVTARGRGTLPRLNEHVGGYWGNNGDTFATRTNLGRTNPHEGGPASVIIEHFDNPINPTTVIVFPEWDMPEGSLTSLGMSIAGELGRFTYDTATDSAKLSFPSAAAGNQRVVEAANYTYKLLDEANVRRSQRHAGSAMEHKPSTEASAGATAHPLGGAVLGKACDLVGRVQGYRGLYVVDGALLPGSTGCANPAFTIAALAERCMDNVLPEVSGGRTMTASGARA